MRKNKAQKIEMAKRLVAEVRAKKLTIKLQGNWIAIEPPSEVPSRMLVDLMHCSEEFYDLWIASETPAAP